MRSKARILSNVSKDGERPPCKQKIYDVNKTKLLEDVIKLVEIKHLQMYKLKPDSQ